MTNPIPGRPITTPYGKRGSHWSCNRDAAGNGVHTGADFAAPSGTVITAARSGTVRHTAYGTAFGSHQFAIVCADGTEDFYAHTLTRPANGAKVTQGQSVAKVGAEGNVTGPHLHFERHKQAGVWNCSNHTNPQPSFDNKEEDDVASAEEIAEQVWATKTDDPVTGEKISMRELLKRTRTNAKQAADD